MHVPLLVVVVLVALVGGAAPAAAQTCVDCWTDACPDLKGYVPKCAEGAPKTTKKKPRPADDTCSEGKTKSADTAGHCCWEGQAWNGEKCVGLPSACPEGYSVDDEHETCAVPACDEGKVRALDRFHCCWPGQAWSTEQGQCLGKAKCPRGFDLLDDGECRSPAQRAADEEQAAAEEEARRQAALRAEELRLQIERDRVEHQRLAEERRLQDEEAERQRVERERVLAERRAEEERVAREAAEQLRAEQMAIARAEQLQEDRDAAARGRWIGVGVASTGAATLLGGALLMAVGGITDAVIMGGGAATGSDIGALSAVGVAANVGAVGAGLVGTLAAGGGLVYFLVHPDPAEGEG